jgi:SAM-dependent methyltransferase
LDSTIPATALDSLRSHLPTATLESAPTRTELASVDAPPAYFWDALACQVPLNLAMWRANELVALSGLSFEGRVLDLGCGNGLISRILFPNKIDVGIDLWPNRLLKAIRRGTYRSVCGTSGTALPFADASFGTVFSNSVLEHIPDIDPVCVEVARVLKPGGRFVFTTPTDNYGRCLFYSMLFERIGLSGLARLYARQVNRVFHHYHTDSPDVWRERLERAGLEVERCSITLTPRLEAIFDVMLPISGIQVALKSLFPSWSFPVQRILSRPFRQWILAEVARRDLTYGGNMLVIGRKPL